MKQNKYDNANFFSAYKKMPRSVKGLEAAGEWHVLRGLMPELRNKTVLDLGCGFGWHCRYAREQQASSVIGVDISENMLQKARENTNDPAISFIKMPIEDIKFTESQFDVVINSLAFHYIKAFKITCQKVYDCLKPGGTFLFSVEHPIFTSRSEQDWYFDEQGNILHWPVDNYQTEGLRKTTFLTENVIKYHRTLSTYINDIIDAGFKIKTVEEPIPSNEMLKSVPEMKDETRRPMFLMISAKKVSTNKGIYWTVPILRAPTISKILFFVTSPIIPNISRLRVLR
ncbi:methyltransferase domain-containing protein [Halobacillus litoralis]|uniref:Methyltransferase domain-containing protein n=1 Tax=Halobacillus litoralis TaxID=45668 RepID=A0A845FCS3_9BACI|nr:methyltransferase domain-containing protein [Halobacillus litoralis]